jgi:hypothetical protein
VTRTPQSDAYLELAYTILEQARVPLSPKEIIKRAYLQNLIPPHLHGKTQHKTLTARLSVDILNAREDSEFFRPWPGRFFLSKFINDESLPQDYRTPIIARRRARHLRREYAAYVSAVDLEIFKLQKLSRADFARLVASDFIQYSMSGAAPEESFQIWNFCFVKKEGKILEYVSGKYRSGQFQSRSNNRTIGFISPLSQQDRNLFDNRYHGTLGSSITNVLVDLDLYQTRYLGDIESQSRFLGASIIETDSAQAIVAVSEIRLPPGCPVMTRKLSMNELRWIDQSDLRREKDALEPWSESVVRHFV